MTTKTQTTKKANVVEANKWTTMEHPVPESLLRAAGMLRNKKKFLEQHSLKVRKEWERSRMHKPILKQ